MLKDNLERIVDFLKDKRQPWFMFHHKIRKMQKLRKVCITFDIEENYPDKSVKGVNEFLIKIQKILDKENIPATFFIQGEIIPKIVKNLHPKKHEIGLHGYKHNNWGNPVWFWSEKPLSIEQKEKDLVKALSLCRKYDLPNPKSFRAPNLNTNADTTSLLQKNGFKVDSSRDSFRNDSQRSKLQNLSEIPVSSFNHQVFNLANYPKIKDKDAYISHFEDLIFLAHPWEFYPNMKFSYCSKLNYRLFQDMIIYLKKSNPKWQTIQQLA